MRSLFSTKSKDLQSLLDGISWGLFLSLLIGPIFFALIQAGIEQGIKAGLMVGLGIWISDFLFIGIVYNGISSITVWTEWDGFKPLVGIIGGLILMGFGIGSFFNRPKQIPLKDGSKNDDPKVYNTTSYSALWLKGFLVNTINPFTLLFWIGLMSTLTVKPNFGNMEASLFFSGLLGMIVLTDSLKVLMAKYIRQWMTLKHILWLRRISGAAFFIFGAAMIARVWF